MTYSVDSFAAEILSKRRLMIEVHWISKTQLWFLQSNYHNCLLLQEFCMSCERITSTRHTRMWKRYESWCDLFSLGFFLLLDMSYDLFDLLNRVYFMHAFILLIEFLLFHVLVWILFTSSLFHSRSTDDKMARIIRNSQHDKPGSPFIDKSNDNLFGIA